MLEHNPFWLNVISGYKLIQVYIGHFLRDVQDPVQESAKKQKLFCQSIVQKTPICDSEVLTHTHDFAPTGLQRLFSLSLFMLSFLEQSLTVTILLVTFKHD